MTGVGEKLCLRTLPLIPYNRNERYVFATQCDVKGRARFATIQCTPCMQLCNRRYIMPSPGFCHVGFSLAISSPSLCHHLQQCVLELIFEPPCALSKSIICYLTMPRKVPPVACQSVKTATEAIDTSTNHVTAALRPRSYVYNLVVQRQRRRENQDDGE